MSSVDREATSSHTCCIQPDLKTVICHALQPVTVPCRISDMEEAGVPVTNYGLFLSYMHSPAALRRAMEPWGLAADI